MVETKKGSPDGINAFEYVKGREYDLPPDLANVFIREGWAKLVDAKKTVSASEKKVIEVSDRQVIKNKNKK